MTRRSIWIVLFLFTIFSADATTPAVHGTAASSTTTTAPVVTGVVNGASFLSGFTQGSWITIFGTNLSGTTRSWTSADFNGSYLPTSLDQVSVTINGKAAYPCYISPTQINVLAPADTTTGSVSVQVTYAGTASNAMSATEASFSPALFMFTPLDGKYVAAVRSDGQYLGPTTLYSGVTVPAQVGDIILLFGTGFGPTTPTIDFSQTFSTAVPTANTVTATIGGVTAEVQYAGLVVPGEYQFNIVVPSVPTGDNLVVLTVDGVSSQANAYLTVGSSGTTSTTTTIAASSTTPTYGASVTLTATVSPSAATGTITFYDGTASLGTGTLSAGSATLATSSLAVGTHTITASYGGSSTYATSTSSSITVTVAAASTTSTTTSLTASPATAYPGSLVVLTATVSPSAATGTVAFYNGTTSLGTGTLSSGTATLTTHFTSTGSYTLKATYGGDSTYASSASSTVSETVASGSYSLDLSTYSATSGSATVSTDSSHTVAYKLYKNVVYAANPVDKTYESMNIFIPTSVDGVSVSGKPILIEIGVGGYMSSSTWGNTSVSGTNSQYALGKGYVVVQAGCRGRDNVSGSTYYGKAPAAMVDLKAAVRFLRYNYSAGNFSGDVDHIIDSGGSAGGALAALLGASGNSSVYDSYLAAIGAADADDNIFAVGAWSPITNLDHADMAYEWEYGSLKYSGSTVNSTVSAELQANFQDYQDGLALTDKRGSYGTLTYSNIDDYILTEYLEPSAATYLESLSSSSLSSYLSSNTWIAWDSTNKKATFTFANYLSHIGSRGKSVPAFDSFFDLSASTSGVNTSQSAEVVEFGDSTTNARHFTDFSSKYVNGTSISSDLQTIVNMMNPMYYIMSAISSGDASGVAKYWYIRDGSTATDTSAMVIVDLATSLDDLLGTSYVDAAEDWDKGHNVNADPSGFSTWVTKSVAAN